MEAINYGKYYTYGELEAVLKDFQREFPEMMKLSSLTETEEGRNVYLAEITNDVNSEKTKEKGGYFIQASMHANECGGGTAALHLIDTLLNEKPDILNDVVFYIVPRINPDGVEANMLANRNVRSKIVRDERRRENVLIPKDLDGDGIILQMRKENPLGDYKEAAPGIMVPREPGDNEGTFYDVHTEGIVENYDETEVTWSIRNYDYNRCYPTNWEPKVYSSEYPLRSPEMRAIAEFVVTHPNIFAGLDFHNGTNGVLCPSHKPDSMFNSEDIRLIYQIGELASETIGFPLIREYKFAVGEVGTKRPGNSNSFFYENLGISFYVIELGDGVNDIGINSLDYFKNGKPMSAYMKDIIKYEEENGNHIFYPFKPFDHPQLGKVEIGGSARGRCYYMNPKNMLDIVPRTTEFVLKHAKMGPVLKVDNCEVLEVAENVFRIRAQIKNLGIFGTKVMKGADSAQAEYPVHISLEIDENSKIYSRPYVYEIPEISALESKYVEWFVKCGDNAEITLLVEHPKAKTVRVKLK